MVDVNHPAVKSMEEILRLIAIISNLASAHEPLDNEFDCCLLCDWNVEHPPTHKPECPWRMAREWREEGLQR